MTTYKIATCHNSLTNGEKAHLPANDFELAASSIGPTYYSRDNHGST